MLIKLAEKTKTGIFQAEISLILFLSTLSTVEPVL